MGDGVPDWLAERRRPQVFYGWIIVLAGYGVFALGGGLLFHAFGSYVKLLEEDFGWSRTQLSVAFSMQRIESGFLGPGQGWMVDRFGPRAVMLLGVTMFGLGFMAFSQVHSLLWFYLVFAVMATGQSLGSMLSLSVALVNWFRRRRALALGLVGTGMATGGILQPVVVAGLEGWGWRTMAFASGVLILAVGLPLTMLVRYRPAEHGLGPDGDPLPDDAQSGSGANGRAGAHGEDVDFAAREAMRTRAFWLLSRRGDGDARGGDAADRAGVVAGGGGVRGGAAGRGLGCAGPADAGAAGGLLRYGVVREDHGLLVADRDDGDDGGPADRGRAVRPDGQLHAGVPAARRGDGDRCGVLLVRDEARSAGEHAGRRSAGSSVCHRGAEVRAQGAARGSGAGGRRVQRLPSRPSGISAGGVAR